MESQPDSNLTRRAWIEALNALSDDELNTMLTHNGELKFDLEKLPRPLPNSHAETLRQRIESWLGMIGNLIRLIQYKRKNNR